MSAMTASTTNYLWSLQDVLGQGATASVYRARNKASHTKNKFIIIMHSVKFFFFSGNSTLTSLPYLNCFSQVFWFKGDSRMCDKRDAVVAVPMCGLFLTFKHNAVCVLLT